MMTVTCIDSYLVGVEVKLYEGFWSGKKRHDQSHGMNIWSNFTMVEVTKLWVLKFTVAPVFCHAAAKSHSGAYLKIFAYVGDFPATRTRELLVLFRSIKTSSVFSTAPDTFSCSVLPICWSAITFAWYAVSMKGANGL